MRAIIKNVPGVLRVESPPFRSAEYVVNENGDRVLRIRIRFAFDAVRAVREGRPTVTLTLRSNPSRNYRKPAIPKNMNLKEAAQALRELVNSNESSLQFNAEANTTFTASATAFKQFTFDLLSAIPDTSISALRQGNPVQYDYLTSTASQPSPLQRDSNGSQAADRDYLLSLVTSGIDPASISENFPNPNPTTGKRDTHSPANFNFYTRRIPSLSATSSSSLLTNFVIFEKDIELNRDEFSLLTSYEFEYLGISEDSATLSAVGLRVKSAEILSQLDSYTDSLEQQGQRFERRLDSYFAISPEPFRSTSSEFRSSSVSVPSITRTHRKLISGDTSPVFKSAVTGKVSSSNGRGSKTTRQEPDIFPFYVKDDRGEKIVQIARLPPGTKRIEVFAREHTTNRGSYQRIAVNRISSGQEHIVPVRFPNVNRTYEIKLIAYDSKERETTSSNTITCSSKASYSGAQLSVSPVRNNESGRYSISIGASFTDSGRQDLTNLIQQLKSAGVSESVIGEISNESSLYSQIFSYRVETIELSTGRQTFSSELSPSSESPNSEYSLNSNDPLGTVINVSLGMKSPEALVPAQSNFRFGKFGGLYRQSQPSAASLSKNRRSGEPFDYVDTGISTTVFIPPKGSSGSVTNLNASKTLRSSTLLRWSYSGDISQIDHFQILGASGDAECLLGCAFRSLSFEDFILSGRVGYTRYTVRPVFLDLSVGSPAFVYQNIDTTLPNLLSPNFRSGSIWNLTDGFTDAQLSLRLSSTQAANFVRQNGSSTDPRNESDTVPVSVSPEVIEFLGSKSTASNPLNGATKSFKKRFASTAPSSSKSNVRSESLARDSRSVTRARK